MLALKLLGRLVLYYLVLAVIVAGALRIFPTLHEYLPVGRMQGLISQAGAVVQKGLLPSQLPTQQLTHVGSLGASIVWLVSVMVGALLTTLPVSWVYMQVRDPEQYDQSLIGTIIVLPIVVASIVVIVQDSLALSFSLAGIAGVARYRNSMKSSGDLMFILLAIGVGLAAGIGAMELAIVTSIIFNLCFVGLWYTEYGERADMKRYLHDIRPDHTPGGTSRVKVTETTTEVVMEEFPPAPEASPVPEAAPAPIAPSAP